MLSTKCVYKSYLICMYKQDLALNDIQWLICHKTQPNQTKPITRLNSMTLHFHTILKEKFERFFNQWKNLLESVCCLKDYFEENILFISVLENTLAVLILFEYALYFEENYHVINYLFSVLDNTASVLILSESVMWFNLRFWVGCVQGLIGWAAVTWGLIFLRKKVCRFESCMTVILYFKSTLLVDDHRIIVCKVPRKKKLNIKILGKYV